ncbi:MAG TPA: IgGFc-binding protein, partial [Polyangiaceae bacterium]
TNYMAVNAWNSGDSNDPDERQSDDTQYPSDPFIQIVAEQDATNVTISPTVAIVGGRRNPNLESSRDVAGTSAGQPATYALSKGDVLQFLQFDELSGSAIGADKPVGVWGGHTCMMIPFGLAFCDSAHQQLLPISWLGSEYVAVRYRDRLSTYPETVPWTLVGTVDDTVLTYDPSAPPAAPTSLMRGQTVRFDAPEPFSIRSQDDAHPFYVAGHMTGGASDPMAPVETGMGGDPEFVNVVPPQQWLSSYVFLTDPTYATTHLVFVRQKGKDTTFKDVTLDCAGALKGWMPVGSSGQFEFTRFDFDKKEGSCTDGAHVAQSDGNFGLTVWGWDEWVSYAYPAGLSTRPVNTVVVKPAPVVK